MDVVYTEWCTNALNYIYYESALVFRLVFGLRVSPSFTPRRTLVSTTITFSLPLTLFRNCYRNRNVFAKFWFFFFFNPRRQSVNPQNAPNYCRYSKRFGFHQYMCTGTDGARLACRLTPKNRYFLSVFVLSDAMSIHFSKRSLFRRPSGVRFCLWILQLFSRNVYHNPLQEGIVYNSDSNRWLRALTKLIYFSHSTYIKFN